MNRHILLVAMLVTAAAAQGPPPAGVAPRRAPFPAGISIPAERLLNPSTDAEEIARRRTQVDALARQAYGLLPQLRERDAGLLVPRMVAVESRADLLQAEGWARGMFRVMAPLSPEERARLEPSPIVKISQADAEAALDLLLFMDGPAAEKTINPNVVSARERTAELVFENLFKQKRLAAVPKLMTVASELESSGTYPYAPLAVVIENLRLREPATAKATFQQSCQHFSEAQFSPGAAEGFVAMLNRLLPLLPQEITTPAVQSLVDKIAAEKPPARSLHLLIYDTNYEFQNANNFLLARLVPALRRANPSLAMKLIAANPDLKATEQLQQESRKKAAAVNAVEAANAGAAPAALESGDNSFADPRLAATSTAVVQLRLPAGERQQVIGQRLAAAALAEIGSQSSTQGKLRIYPWLVQGYLAAGDTPNAIAALHKGMQLGQDFLFSQAPAEHTLSEISGDDAMARLFGLARQIQPEYASQQLAQVHALNVKAEYLVGMAEALARSVPAPQP